jgi:molybdenum-dependent DNA-binding transcriptional regulator ModE
MKNITFRAEEALIEAARRRAQQDHTSLNEAFRRWLDEYAHQRERMQRYDEVMSPLRGSVKIGCKLTREARNER